MWLVTRRGLVAHKLRLALTATAVVLGVGFVAGSFMLGDTLERAFTTVITETAGGVDVEVRPADAGADFSQGLGSDRAGVPGDLLDEIEGIEGVAAAEPEISGFAQIVGPDGQPVGTTGAPTFGFNAPADPDSDTGIDLREGRLPESEGEVAVDAFTAEAQDFSVGDDIGVAANGPVEQVELVGIVGFGSADNLAGATVTLFDHDTAMERFSPDGDYDSVSVIADSDVSQEQLAEDISAVVSDEFEVVTAQELVDENVESVGQIIGIFSTVLLVFAAVALFVGGFIIVNTFSIIVAQRIREFALLRAVGASRRQVLGSVLTEAGAVGLFGGVVGLGVGALLALALRALMSAFGFDLPAEGLVFLPRTAVIAVVVGLLVTVVAAVVPALRATRVAPVQALQSVAVPTSSSGSWRRNAIGGLLAAIGVALLVAGLFADAGLPALGAGAVLVFLGVAVLSPLIARPVLALLGWPIARALGVRGELARENAMRNPRRTATTASALMIGVGLVGFVTILAASMSASLTDSIEDVYRLDFDVRSAGFQPIAPDIGDRLAELDEVRIAVPQRMTALADGQLVMAVDADRLTEIYALEVVEGTLDDLGPGAIIVSESAAESEDLAVGDPYPAEFTASGETELEVAGIFEGDAVDVSYIIDTSTYTEHVRAEQVFAVGVRLADGVDLEAGQEAIDGVLADYPGVQALDRAGVRDQLTGQINQLLGMVYGLLALAVVIAFFGIINTLALSVFERVREIGLLRAVGMTRRQVRAMVRWESVMTAVLGAVLGLAVGVLFGWLLVTRLQDEFPLRLVVPGGQLAIAVVVAAVAGVLAGVFPARRAARVDMLRALTAE